jgi:hypothetical protein
MAHAFKGDGANGAVIVHDGLAVAEALFGVAFGGRDAGEQVFEEVHVQGLREDGAGDLGADFGSDFGVDDENFEELFGAFAADDVVKSVA